MSETEAATRDKRVELIAAIMLSIATVLTAWSAYQATRWSGEQSEDYTSASALRTESVRAANVANAQSQVDVATFLDWLDATDEEDQTLADDIHDRMRDEFLPAFDEWLASAHPGEVPEGTPFDLDSYRLAATEESERLEERAAARFDEGREANQIGDNFVLAAVMLASVLFFAGIAGTLDSRTPQILLLSLAGLMLVAGTVVIALLPPNVGL
ncbi:MAG TPA: hypothetical protein VJ913_10490 [Actinomycetota bacterium]|nr:hypothetical protein [Actinomycetota bacterium]